MDRHLIDHGAYLPLLAMLAWAAVQDLRARRIRNWLTFAMILSGLAQSFGLFGAARTVTPGAAMLGVLVGLALPFALFAIGALGGGDVKLLMGVGAWLGPMPVLAVFAVGAIFGMVIVLAQAAATGRLRVLTRNTAVLAVNLYHLNDVGVDHLERTGKSCRSVDRPLPYAVPVLAATALVLYVSARGGRL